MLRLLHSPRVQRYLAAVTVVALLLPISGCGFLSHLMYWTGGNLVQPRFAGLKDKKVAIVCFDANASGPAPETDAVAKAIGAKLTANDIQVVPHQQVLNWLDRQDSNVNDFIEVGKGVNADMVIGVELESFRIHDGSTLLRGRARTAVKVYDLKAGGKLVYETPMQDVVYPENGSRMVSTDNETAFKHLFIDVLSRRISKDFYAYDHAADFAQDAMFKD